jgi:hypothetical protein
LAPLQILGGGQIPGRSWHKAKLYARFFFPDWVANRIVRGVQMSIRLNTGFRDFVDQFPERKAPAKLHSRQTGPE